MMANDDLHDELVAAACEWRDGLIPGTSTSTQGPTRRLRELVDRIRCDHPRAVRVHHVDGRRSCGKCGQTLEWEAPTPTPAQEPVSEGWRCVCGHGSWRHVRHDSIPALVPPSYPCKECDCQELMAAEEGGIVKLAVSVCRHCGEPIAMNGTGHWAHFTLYRDGVMAQTEVGWLNRCQTNVPQYGYEAQPPSDEPCECWACGKLGRYTWGAEGRP